jgi:hypothetical protein
MVHKRRKKLLRIMCPEEVEKTIQLLRDAAETLEWVRRDHNELKFRESPQSSRYFLKRKIVHRATVAEAIIRQAIEPVDWFE